MFQSKQNKLRQNIGMTLIEVIVYVALFTFLNVALFNAILFFYQSNRYTIEQTAQVQTARQGVTSMVQDIRKASYSETGAFPLISAGANSFSFYSDINNDGNTEKVRYFLDGELFKKGFIIPSGTPLDYTGAETITTVTQYVRNGENNVPIFQYYDKNGTLLTDYSNVANIAFVKVNLIVNVNPATLPNEFDLRSSATLRNLKTNL